MMNNRTPDSDLLLAIDVGNTNVTLGIFITDCLQHHWRLATKVSRTSDEAWIALHHLCQSENVDLQQIRGVAISSVVPDLTSIFVDMVKQRFDLNPYEVRADTAPSLKIHYHDPLAVGADRICNAVAGFEKHGGPLIIVDFGTATTYDIISRGGEYLGGIITPGIELAVQILHYNAARLPKVPLLFPPQIIAKTTDASIQAGLLYGAVEALAGLVRRIWDELGDQGKVITTGGLSTLITAHSDVISAVEPFLVLEGLRLLYERHGE
ncbi:MAG: type III pantothenate kinase [bacterium]